MIEAIKAAVKGRDARGVDSRCCHPGGRQSQSPPSVVARDGCLRDFAISSRHRSRHWNAITERHSHNARLAWQLWQSNQHGPSLVSRRRFRTNRSRSRHHSHRIAPPMRELGPLRCTLRNVRPTAIGRRRDSTQSSFRTVYSLISHVATSSGGFGERAQKPGFFDKPSILKRQFFRARNYSSATETGQGPSAVCCNGGTCMMSSASGEEFSM